MPARARPADPDRLLAELSPTWQAALLEARETCALGPHWQACEQLQVVVTHVAALQLAARFAAAGIAEDVALERAAGELGISADSIRTRQRRWYRESRATFRNEPAACSPAAATLSVNKHRCRRLET